MVSNASNLQCLCHVGFAPKRWCLQSHPKKQEPVFVVPVITLKAVRLLHRMRKKHRVLSATEVGELVKGA